MKLRNSANLLDGHQQFQRCSNSKWRYHQWIQCIPLCCQYYQVDLWRMKAAHLKSSLSMMGNVLQEYWFCDQVFFSWITILNVKVQILIWLVYLKFFFEKENYQSKIASIANIWRNEIITLTLFKNILVIQLWLLGADWKNCYIEDVISFKVLTEDLCTIIFERMKLSTETCALYLFCKWWANESFLKDTTPRTSVRGSDWFFLNLQEYYWYNLSLRPPLLVLLSAGEKQSFKGNVSM